MPFTNFMRPNGRPGLRMGVFDARDRVVPQSLLVRSYGKVGFAARFDAATRNSALRDPRTVIYAGRLTRHFGHFMLEGLASLWYAREHPELPIAWAWPSDRPGPEYKPWQPAILEVLGIANEPIFVDRPMRFGRVVVPDPGYRIKDFMAPQQAAFLAAYPARQRDPGLRLWLSRTRIDPGIIHAPRLEAALAAAGWTVIQPETLTIPQQLELLATAGRVAGDQGSAFHLLALLSDVRGLVVDVFCRHPGRTVAEQNANYLTIARARSLDQRMHVVPQEVLIEERSAHVVKLATTLTPYLDILGVEQPRPEWAGPAPGTRLASDLAGAAGARSYLELTASAPLGVELHVPLRHIVSEVFPFDPRARAGDGLALYEMPPADYFEHLVGPERRFDLIVIDGAADPATEWVAAAREHTHTDTTWLIAGETPAGLEHRARQFVEDGRTWTVIPGTRSVEAAIGSRASWPQA